MSDNHLPNLLFGKWLATPRPSEEVVITGVSGRFPDSSNIQELRNNLFEKKYMVGPCDKRWTVHHPEIPPLGGVIPDISKFDPGFFGIHYRQVKNMDPAMRSLLEVALESIVDAGFQPCELEGSRTGVFIGYSFSDTDIVSLKGTTKPHSFGIMGYLRSTLSHRLSYFLKLRGPSYCVDTACSSSSNALEHAFKAIRRGQCDCALVGGLNLTLHPLATLQTAKLGVLGDGISKVFDEDADGYVRSETVACLFLQKLKNSRRVYTQIVHAKINQDGFKTEGITFPSAEMQARLLEEIYKEADISSSQLSYVELHGTGTKVGDTQEITALDDVIAKRRDTQLLIGSIKSNIGHTESASGIASIVKIILAMEYGYLAPNLHLTSVKKGMTGLKQGRMKVVTEATPLHGAEAIVGVSNLGFGGNNCHVILKRVNIEITTEVKEETPLLICVSGRNEAAIQTLILELNQSTDHDHIALVHQIFKKHFASHYYKGYTILTNRKFGRFGRSCKPVAQFLLQFPIFKDSLSRLGMDAIFDEGTGSGLETWAAAVQVAICDILRAVGLTPINIGHEEVVPAYFGHNASSQELLGTLMTMTHDRELTVPEQGILLDLSDANEALGQDPISFLDLLGMLYIHGYDLQLHELYTKTRPVKNGTKMTASLLKWNHDKEWYTKIYTSLATRNEASTVVNLSDESYKYIEGHVIDGRNLFPATAYLYLIWEYLATERLMQTKYFPVVFENCKFLTATTMSKTESVTFTISLHRASGHFEITEGGTIVVTGTVYSPPDIRSHSSDFESVPEYTTDFLDTSDIYKELQLRGYNYSGVFKGLVQCDLEATRGLVKWENNWAAFMDKMLQIHILQKDSRLLYIPTGIRKVVIDPVKHLELATSNGELNFPFHAYRESDIIRSGGIEISGLQTTAISMRRSVEPVIEKYVFAPNELHTTLLESVRINIQIILEESLEKEIKAVEFLEDCITGEALIPLISKILEDVPLIQQDLVISPGSHIGEIPGAKIKPVKLTSTSNLLLIVVSKVMERPSYLNQILDALSPNGFVLAREPPTFTPNDLHQLTILTQHTLLNEKLILFRKSKTVDNIYTQITSQNFDWISRIKQRPNNNIVVYTQNQSAGGILGFIKCLRYEPGGENYRCFCIIDEAPSFEPDHPFYREQIKKNQAINVYKNSKWGTYRHLQLEPPETGFYKHSYLSIGARGDLSSMKWVQGNFNPEKNVVHIYYSAINFKDVMTAIGRIAPKTDRFNHDHYEGFEFSGRNSSGNRVMGMVSHGALSNLLDSETALCLPVPNEWTLEDAATVPIVYSTVIFALFMRTTLKPGESILIHSATGGVGLAALNVSLRHECNVFVTVGTQEKKRYLQEKYPQIPVSHIGNSRDTSFEDLIKTETKGRGVDIVLNSLAEDKLRASVRCLARGGKFIEIGKYDLMKDNSLDLILLEKEASYSGVMLDNILDEVYEVKRQFCEIMTKVIDQGYIKPLPRTVFSRSEVEKAFKFMTTGTHVGKVLVQIKEPALPEHGLYRARPKYHCDPDKVYIILGGFSGFGIELADWLVLRGAKKLVLTSRSKLQTGYQKLRIKTWTSYGATIYVTTHDTTTKRGVTDTVREALKFGRIDATFNLAVMLKDALFQDQTAETFKMSLAPKAFATKHLDEVTRVLCPDLRHFVVFSSVTCGRGNAGQTNYGMANSIMEQICENRKQDGYPGLAIQWGALGDVGLVAKMQKYNQEVVVGGTLQQKVSDCLSLLDRFLNQDNPIVASMVVAEKRKKIRGGSVVDAVANVLVIKDIHLVSQHATLTELGMDSMMATEIMQILEKEFDIYLSLRDIRTATFAKLLELQSKKNSSASKKVQELDTLVQYIPDGSIADASLVALPSRIAVGEEGPTVFVLPGVEGVFNVLEPLTKNLKACVFGLHYSYKNPEDSIEEIAKSILQHVCTEQPVHLVCYSFGVTVGVELLSLLEEQGSTGTLIAIDGSPEYVSSKMRAMAFGKSDAELETTLLSNVLARFLPVKVLEENKENFIKCESVEQRIDLGMSLTPRDTSGNEKMEKQAVITLYKRFMATLNYKFNNKKIISRVILCKAKYTPNDGLGHDYQLSDLCANAVTVKEIDGDHVTILQRRELVDFINETLKKVGS